MGDIDDVISQALADAQEEEDSGIDLSKSEALSQAIQKQIQLEDDKERLEDALKTVNKTLEKVRTQTVPDLMLEMKMRKFETDEGFKVSVDEVVYASVKKADMPQFVEWLEERGDEGIVNPKISISIAKGDLSTAEQLFERLRGINDLNFDADYQPEIHWQTLRSFAKEQHKEGTEFPNYVTVHPTNVAKIKRR